MILLHVALLDSDLLRDLQHFLHIDRAVPKFFKCVVGDLPFVVANFSALFQILEMNLCDSAIEFLEGCERVPTTNFGPKNIEFKLA